MTELERIEFGDFQTPLGLAGQVVELLKSRGVSPRSVVEPTCGHGAFVEASLLGFQGLAELHAFDINADYVAKTSGLARIASADTSLACRVSNFFAEDWREVLRSLPEPVLVLGNPPWVTASGLGALGSSNLPEKTNFQNRRGLDAVTGKSNFDVAEWMLLRLLEAGRDRDATLAMLVKTSVARRVLSHLWRTGVLVKRADILRFDAGSHFAVSADACLFLCQLGSPTTLECSIGALEAPGQQLGCMGWRDGALVSDPSAHDRHKHLLAPASTVPRFRWRSGVKHDCSAIMELRRVNSTEFVNGNGESVRIESDYVYPLFKGTDLAHGRVTEARRWLLVTQCRPGEDTAVVARRAPDTWAYLCAHGADLDARRSSIYRGKPRFAVFGVGPYSFSPWKVAISALHKRLTFAVVGPIEGRPAVFDDTCYHLSFETENAARCAWELLSADCSVECLSSLVFWDAKRPITTEVLQRLDLARVAAQLGRADEFAALLDGGSNRVAPQAHFDFDVAPTPVAGA